MMNKVLLLTALIVVPACEMAAPSGPKSADSCGAARYESLRGAPESQVTALSFNQPVRIVGPRDAVTLDHNPDRLNFLTDSNGIVTSITCG